MDYFKYITGRNTKKDSWDTKITALKVEVDNDLDYGSIIKATKSRTSNISNQLRRMREESALEDIKLRNEDPIEGFYQDILDRDSDPKGKKYWQQKFDEGMSLTDIKESFLRSDEYKKLRASTDTKVLEEGKATLEDIKLRNKDPIEGFYQDILGRDSDPEGKKDWQQKFDEGMSLTDIQEQFLTSDEYKNKPK